MKNVQRLTHAVAVNAYLLYEDKFLLLLRTKQPRIWVPPGGRLLRLEDPIAGLKREVFEETGQTIEVLDPVTTWFGKFNDGILLSIDYCCRSLNSEVTLSAEHSDFCWLTLRDLRKNKYLYISSGFGFQLTDYEKAWSKYYQHSP